MGARRLGRLVEIVFVGRTGSSRCYGSGASDHGQVGHHIVRRSRPAGTQRARAGRMQLVIGFGATATAWLANVGLVLGTFVVHEMVSPSESTSALGALERLFTLVNEHVSFELIGVGEATSAQFAGVGSLASVHPQMPPQVGHLHELSIAVSTVIWLLARMKTHVCLEVMISGESFMALSAFERFFTGMGPLMVLQNVFVTEATIAYLTDEHFLAAARRACCRTRAW